MRQASYSTGKPHGKAQSAIEMLSVYSWALLLIAIVVMLVFILTGPFAPAQYLASTCNIQPLMLCTQTYLVAYNTTSGVPIHFVIIFMNNMGVSLKFPADSLNLTTQNLGVNGTSNALGYCTPSEASDGAEVVCTASIYGTKEPPTFSSVLLNFKLTYYTCKGGTCTGPYVSTGSSTQQLYPSSFGLTYLKIVTNPPSGKIILNGITYDNGVKIPLEKGNFTLYALAPKGYSFSYWNITPSASNVLSHTTMPTKLVLNGNATLTTNFTK